MLSGRVSDPPAVFRKGFVPCEGFRPAGRPPLPAAAKEANRRRGRLTSPSETSSLRFQFVLPQSPVYGRYPYTFPQNFRRAKYGSRVLVPSGPLGPDAVQNSGLFQFTAAPGSDQPWQRVRDRGCADWDCSENKKQRAGVPPLRRFRDPVWFQRDRRGFKAAAVAISRMTEIAL